MSEQAQSAAPAESTTSQEPQTIEQQLETPASEESSTLEATPDAAPEAVKKAEEKKRIKRLKLKIDGKEFEEELPFEIDDDPKNIEFMQRQMQLAKMGQKRAQDYAALEKDVVSFIEQLRKNPRKALSNPDFGIDVKQLAAQIIEEEIENAKKSPEQLEKEKLEEELRTMKEEREREKEDFKKKELERHQNEAFERYDVLMTQALEKSDLPKSPYIVKKMADYMLMALEEGHDVTPEDVIPLVRDEMVGDLKDMFATMPEEVIESIIGKETINKIRKKSIAKAKQSGAPTSLKSGVKDTGKASEPNKTQDGKKLTIKELLGV